MIVLLSHPGATPAQPYTRNKTIKIKSSQCVTSVTLSVTAQPPDVPRFITPSDKCDFTFHKLSGGFPS
jgi:hypothetical protein